MKKLLSLLMLLCLTLTVAPAALAEEVVNVYNWEDYIAPEVLTLFTEETGIKVNYMCFTTNEDMIVQVEANPGAFDVCFPSDYIIERMIAKDLLAEINYDNVPNFEQIIDKLRNPDYDPENKYSVPYMWDSMGITLKYLGYSMNSREVPELMAAKDKLIEQKQSGVVKAYQVDETKDKMVAGEAALALMWSGDAQYAIDLNDHLDYFVPSEGSNIWVDGAVILKSARNKENAEKFINFLCRPDIAQMNCEYIWYSSPNKGAIELMGEEYENNHVLNPSQEVQDRCEFFHDIDDTFRKIYENLWMEIKNTK